jgi:hypothetical protein
MPKNQFKRQKGTVVETLYVRKTSSRGEVKIVAKHQPRSSPAHHPLKNRVESQPRNADNIEVPLDQQDAHQPSQATPRGKVCRYFLYNKGDIYSMN